MVFTCHWNFDLVAFFALLGSFWSFSFVVVSGNGLIGWIEKYLEGYCLVSIDVLALVNERLTCFVISVGDGITVWGYIYR